MTIILHAKKAAPPWHPRYTRAFVDGFEGYGIAVEVCERDLVQRGTHKDIHVLFGPNYWSKTFRDADRVLCVDRCSFGNENDNVTIGWNGWKGFGIYPTALSNEAQRRYAKYRDTLPEANRHVGKPGKYAVLIGEYPSACDDQNGIKKFYEDCIEDAKKEGLRLVLRPHPHHTPRLGLDVEPRADIYRAAKVYTYASSFGVQARLTGANVVAGPGSLAYRYQKQDVSWRLWLPFTQWHISEIESGEFWRYLADANR